MILTSALCTQSPAYLPALCTLDFVILFSATPRLRYAARIPTITFLEGPTTMRRQEPRALAGGVVHKRRPCL